MLTKSVMSNNKDMFEISVAVIGYVSVGKTTVLNALFGDEFGQVSMQRTTAVVNSFKISNSSEGEDCIHDGSEKNEDSEDDSIDMVSHRLTASVTLQETTQDNATFRNIQQVQERSFEIELEEPLHTMRPDTKLVVVDIPGINEAGTSSRYKDYVQAHWHRFDVVVLMMDARQGVNTEEQHALLQLAKDNLSSIKDLPLIILSNKVDNPEDEEQLVLLNEARKAVEALFAVDDRKEALDTLMAEANLTGGAFEPKLFPAVIPISAMHAFLYRCGARLDFDAFSKMDADFIDKIGKDSYGRQWRRYDKKKQLEMAYKAVSDPEHRLDGLEASNFDAFTTALSFCIGDKDRQAILIEKQIAEAMERMEKSTTEVNLSHEILEVHKKLQALSKPTDNLKATFWNSYNYLKTSASTKFQKTFSPKAFATVVGQLCNYVVALKSLPWPDQAEEVSNKARELVLEYGIGVLESEEFKAKTLETESLILRSMLLPTSDPVFYCKYGFLKMHLEAKLAAIEAHEKNGYQGSCCKTGTQKGTYGIGTETCGTCKTNYIEESICKCPNCIRQGHSGRILCRKLDGNALPTATCSSSSCRLTFYILRPTNFYDLKAENGNLVPVDEEAYKQAVTLEFPESLDDPEHFGYVFWKCCELHKNM